ncbi:MAG: tetratricopeptide repeat protein, partial [Myxococcales bacterium]|nr:tetratricopeptide repeat protein [Myxococcales bacterium]
RRGALEEKSGDYANAEFSLRRALWAAEAGRHDEVAVDGLTLLLGVVGDRLARHEDTKALTERLTAALARLGDDNLRKAQAYNTIGRVYASQGEYEEAVKLQLKAVRLGEQLFDGGNHPVVATFLLDLGQAHESLDHDDEARARYERALAILEESLGERHPDVAASMSNLGIQLRSADRHAEARALLERALEIREEALGPEHPDVIASLNNLAGLLTAMNEHSDALAAYERALARLEAAGGVDGEAGSDRKMEATIAYNIGLSHVFLRDEEAARRAFERSLALFEGLYGDANAYVAFPIEGIADTYLGEERYDEALAFFERALAIRRETQGADHPEYARSLSRIANIQRQRGALEEALALDREALAIYENRPDPFRIVVLLGLGETASKLGRDEEAIARFEEALALAKTNENPLREASAAFALAQALWKRPAARARALALAEAAEGVLIDKGSPDTAAAVVKWLGERRK